jgi:tetratricopeptide (TPR) repeat protein
LELVEELFYQAILVRLLLTTTWESTGKHCRIAKMTLKLVKKTLPPNHPRSATSYNNIGTVYRNMEEYSKALSFYEKIEISLKLFPSNHPHLDAFCTKIVQVHDNMDYYSKALPN